MGMTTRVLTRTVERQVLPDGQMPTIELAEGEQVGETYVNKTDPNGPSRWNIVVWRRI